MSDDRCRSDDHRPGGHAVHRRELRGGPRLAKTAAIHPEYVEPQPAESASAPGQTVLPDAVCGLG